jgi:cell division transport system ATP-binding protein
LARLEGVGRIGAIGYTARDLVRRARVRNTPQQKTQLMVLTPDFDTRPVISFQHVFKTYPTGTEALRDINLEVPEGDFLFLVGPSGAGKSTLVRLLIREEKPSKGKIFVDGVELGRMKRRKLPYYRRKVGLVFQDFKLLPNLTVYENVAFALRVLGEPDSRVQTSVAEAIDTVSLSGKEHTYPANLSGGEQQRVAIARALVHAPRFIIADEPTGNLDPATAWEIMQLFLRINARGATVVMATHNREIVDLLRRRVIAIDAGQIARDDRSGRYHDDVAKPQVRAQ